MPFMTAAEFLREHARVKRLVRDHMKEHPHEGWKELYRTWEGRTVLLAAIEAEVQRGREDSQ